MARLLVSVFIIAKNEADRIEKTIKSVRDLVDEVIVIDSGSADATVEVSEKLGARVVFNEWKGYGAQKIYGESLCRNNWLLNLDADEEVTEELAKSIRTVFEDPEPKHRAYRTKRKLLFRFEEKPPRFGAGDNPIRLYHKNYAGFKDSTVHDSVLVREGTVGSLKGVIIHRCFRDLSHWVKKIDFYSSMQAKDFIEKGRKPSSIRILFEPTLSFLKAYILRRYALYGVDGFIGSFLYAYARFLRMAKARELMKEKQHGEDK